MLIALANGCGQPLATSMRVDVFHDVYYAAMDSAPPSAVDLYDVAENRITLAGAINETLTMSMRIQSGGLSAGRLRVEVSDLVNGEQAMSSGACALFQAQTVSQSRLPGWHIRSVAPQGRLNEVPDVLVPLHEGELIRSTAANGARLVWIDLAIPKGAAPGRYQGTIQVFRNDRIAFQTTLHVTVWPIVLPDESGVVLLGDLDHLALFAHHVTRDGRPFVAEGPWSGSPEAGRLDDLLLRTLRMLRVHGVDGQLPALRPPAKVGADDNLQIDWTAYDRVAGPFLDGSAFFSKRPITYWMTPFDKDFPPAPAINSLTSPAYTNACLNYLTDFAAHFAEQGWLDQSYVRIPGDTAVTPASCATVRRYAELIHQADARLLRWSTRIPQNMAGLGWDGYQHCRLDDDVDIWCPPARYCATESVRRLRSAGKHAFWSLDDPPYTGSIDLCAAPADTRIITWQADRLGIEAVHLGTLNQWPSPRPKPAIDDCRNGTHAPLIYPGSLFGRTEPIPSARLKRIRRGQMDLALLTLLRDAGLDHVGAILGESLVPHAGLEANDANIGDPRLPAWPRNPAQWAALREIISDALVSSTPKMTYAEQPSSSAIVPTTAWDRFLEPSRRLRADVDGVRVRPAGPVAAGVIDIVSTITLRNPTRKRLSGDVEFASLPAGWSAEAPAVAFDSIAPRHVQRLQLRARALGVDTIPVNSPNLPIVIRTSDDETQYIRARLAFIAAVPIADPLRIDGDLADWPPAIGNLAEGFHLIGDTRSTDASADWPAPTQPTQCFAAADGDAIYFGIIARLGARETPPPANSNMLRYESGVPVQEELIELLFDPTNAGGRSPAELYHLVVKPYGWFAEKGVRMDPQIGPCSPWTAHIELATRVLHDRWIAEIRIPRNAFAVDEVDEADGVSAAARRSQEPIWGFNVTRFHAAQQEFATWSCNRPNAYDPAGLGNLAIP